MTDFYQLMFGRPSPGRRAFDYALFDRGKQTTRRTPEQVSSGAEYEGTAPPMPPEWASRLSERGRYAGSGPSERPVVYGPGAITGEEPERVPFREAARPDFAEFVRGRAPILPERLEARGGPEEPAPRGLPPPDANEERAPFNPTQEWIAAEERSGARWRAGTPSQADMFFALVFGRRGGQAPRSRSESQ